MPCASTPNFSPCAASLLPKSEAWNSSGRNEAGAAEWLSYGHANCLRHAMHTSLFTRTLEAARRDSEEARRNLHDAVVTLRRAGRIQARLDDFLTGSTSTAEVVAAVRLEAVMSHGAGVQRLQRLFQGPRDAPGLKERGGYVRPGLCILSHRQVQ
jgi:arylamine N-acetyltransferase